MQKRKITKEYFKLYACCIPVKGSKRSLICDIQRNTVKFIPNDLFEIFTTHKNKSVEEIKVFYGKDNHEVVDEYFEFLISKEFGFFTKFPELFPELDLYWDEPAKITNAIIDWNRKSNHDFNGIFKQLEDLGCKHIQIRFFDRIKKNILEEINKYTKQSTIKSIEIALKYDPTLSYNHLEKMCKENLRIFSVFIHSAPEYQIKSVLKSKKNSDSHIASIIYDKDEIIFDKQCGLVSKEYFAVNVKLFTEAQKFNTCLNRKISIDVNGEIKNCPSADRSFGNIENKPLQSALNEKAFNALWQINKDKVQVCKDCEFRYICTDCRFFIQNKKDPYSKPSKCSYDPYTATWG